MKVKVSPKHGPWDNYPLFENRKFGIGNVVGTLDFSRDGNEYKTFVVNVNGDVFAYFSEEITEIPDGDPFKSIRDRVIKILKEQISVRGASKENEIRSMVCEILPGVLRETEFRSVNIGANEYSKIIEDISSAQI